MSKVGSKPVFKRATNSNRLVYERQAAICKAFGHPSRIHLLDLVGKGERSCGALQQELSISKANLSQHISQLKKAGVLATRRDGKQIYCSIALPEVKDACDTIRKVLRSQIRHAQRMLSR